MIILYWWYWDIKFHICNEQNMHSWKKEYQINDKDNKKSPTVESIKPLWILIYPKYAMIWDTTIEIL